MESWSSWFPRHRFSRPGNPRHAQVHTCGGTILAGLLTCLPGITARSATQVQQSVLGGEVVRMRTGDDDMCKVTGTGYLVMGLQTDVHEPIVAATTRHAMSLVVLAPLSLIHI